MIVKIVCGLVILSVLVYGFFCIRDVIVNGSDPIHDI